MSVITSPWGRFITRKLEMRINIMKTKFTIIFTFIILMTACGGGGGGPLLSSITGSGITGSLSTSPIKTRGVITGFGSIFVNGVEFETDSADVTLDDNTGVQSDLKLGMVVEITGAIDDGGTTGNATQINFDDDVQGPVSTITDNADLNQKELLILDTTVIADAITTIFEDVTFDTLSTGDLLEVSGFFDASGNLLATRIEKKEDFTAGTSEIEIKGTVSNLLNSTFSLGSFTVDFSTADLNEVPGGSITSGMFVEVKGTLNGVAISATEVDLEDDFFGEDEDEVSVEGVISSFNGSDDFIVAGQQIDASSAVLFPATLNLQDDISVEVEGPIVGGVLIAETVEARDGEIELSGNVSSVNASTRAITLQFANGTITFITDAKTQLEDDTDVVDILTFDDINSGDYLEVKALDNGSELVALEVKRDEDDEDKIQGPVESFSEQNLTVTVLGLTFSVDGAVFENVNDVTITASEFFNTLTTSSLIKLVDENTDGTAEEVEFE